MTYSQVQRHAGRQRQYVNYVSMWMQTLLEFEILIQTPESQNGPRRSLGWRALFLSDFCAPMSFVPSFPSHQAKAVRSTRNLDH